MSETIKREWKTLPEPNKIVTCDKQDRVLATVERRKSGDWHWQVHPLFGYGLLNYQGIEPKKELAMRAAEKAIEGEELQRDIQRTVFEYRIENRKHPTHLLLDRESYQLLKTTYTFAHQNSGDQPGNLFNGMQIAILEGIQQETIKVAG